jgi:hypothetical protein
MRDAGMVVCESPSTLGKAMKDLLSGKKGKGREERRAAKPAAPQKAPGKGAGPRATVKKSNTKRG